MADPPVGGPGSNRSSAWLAEQLATKQLERQRPDPKFQKFLLHRVGRSLHFIDKAPASDPDSEFTLAYDAIRHCIDVHLNVNGLRVMNVAGAHRLYVAYARACMAEIISEDDLRLYATFRPIRNASEYPAPGDELQIPADAARTAFEVAKRFFKAATDAARS